jgi:hypothetical protein
MWSNLRAHRIATSILAYLPIETRSRLRWGAQLQGIGLFEEEKQIGVRPFFSAQQKDWLSPFLPFSYSKIWNHLGAIGMNYVSVSLKGSQSKILPLFDPQSPYYHAWFGLYAIVGDSKPFGFKQGKPVPSAIAPLILADQSYWQLLITGTSTLEPKVTYLSEAEEITLPLLAERAFLFYGRISSHSVLIPPEKQTPQARYYFPLPEEKVWNMFVDPCHPLEQGGFAVTWPDYMRGITFCAYGTAASFTDKQGRQHDYIRIVESELLTLLGKLRLRSL